jgi:predicted alpha-1,2-mannosidase
MFMRYIVSLLLSLTVISARAQSTGTDFAAYVNPMIGTGGHGHTYPGAVLPFGMMQLSPDTRLDGWDGCSGYHYSDSVIYGFSHTHLSGTGCSDYGDILLMPATSSEGLGDYGYASSFTHQNEKAQPGYYAVFLNQPQVQAELTTSQRVGFHRYTFPHAAAEWLVVNLKHRDEVLNSKLEVVNPYTLQGYRFSKAWARNQKVFFEIRFSKPIVQTVTQAKGGVKSGAIAAFQFENDGKPLLVKVAISAVDEAGAHNNLQAEMPGWNFNQYRNKAYTLWNKELSKLDVQGGTKDQRTVFYTALYHSMSAPNIYSDVDYRYRGRDDRIHSTGGTFDYYTVFSLWDTYRGEHPLLTIIDKKRTSDFINTFIREYEEGGRLPVWELSSNETECMIGYHAVPVIWDAYSKGIRGFNAEKAFEAMKHSAMLDHFGLASYKQYGFVRSDDEHENVSKTLEYAYDDWCIAQLAKALNKTADYNYFMQRAQSWKNVFDPTTGFMRPRSNGMLYTPFSPYTVDNNFTEANSWQYSFYVPQDIPGLITAMGGKAAFEQKLDDVFHASTETEGREQADITGLIGQYAHGNEPSHHIAYLYNYVDKPEKTSAIVKQVMDSFYRNAPDGLIGNEDCGQMSAWYVLSALGFYPVCPGMGHVYEPGYRLFKSIRVSDDAGHSFTVDANGQGPIAFSGHNESSDAPAIVPNPYIDVANKVFAGRQQIVIGCMDHNAAIYYSLNGGKMKAYSAPFTITGNARIDFYTQKGNDKSPVQHAQFYKLRNDRSIVLHSVYNKQYTAGGANGLIDGLHGTTNWRGGGWQGYQGQDFDGVVVFKKPKKISGIMASFLEDQQAWIFYPKSVSFYASDDSVHWRLIQTIPTRKSDHDLAVTISTFATAKPVTARFIKVSATSFGDMPQWHEGRGNPTFIFIDEIEVD